MPLSPDAWANILFQFSDVESDVWPINRITLGQRGTDNGFWLGINDPVLGNNVRYRWKHVLDGYFDDAWHHVVLRIAADGVWSLFVDAVDTGEIFTHLIPNVRYTANGIGGSLWGDSLCSTGFVDDFRIYQKGLTAGEIAAIYAGDLDSAEANIAAPVSTECEACTPGLFSANGTTCEPCAPGSISTHYNATRCEECNATSTSFRGTTTCFDLAAHLAATGCVCGV